MTAVDFYERIARLVADRGLARGVADLLVDACDERLLAELERASYGQIAEVSALWRAQQEAAGTARAVAGLRDIAAEESA